MGHDLTVQNIRDEVREYFDLEVDDLPDRIIDRWISEGWGKIVRYRPNWPGFETVHTLNIEAGAGGEYVAPLKDVSSIETPDRQLVRLTHDQAQHRFAPSGTVDPPGTPVVYTVYAGKVRFWPAPDQDATYTVRGYRAAINPLEQPDTEAIDLPHPDAAEVLLAWVIYRAAIRESEMETAADYKDSFSQGIQLLAKDEVDVPGHSPIVLNSQPAYGPSLGERFGERELRMDGVIF